MRTLPLTCVTCLFLAATGLAASSAHGQETVRGRGMLGAAHAVAKPQSDEFGWGPLASVGAELAIRPELFATFTAEGLVLAEGDPPPPPLAPQGMGRAGFLLFGLRGYPVRELRNGLRPWLSAGTGYVRTDSTNRVAVASDLGLDVPVSSTTTLGPFAGYRHVFQPDSDLRPDDANIAVFGVQGTISHSHGPAEVDRDTDRDGIINELDRCPMDPEDYDGFEDRDGCPDVDNDRDGILDTADRCPDKPEDRDGFEDADGCPDEDNDKDRIPDSRDRCPDVPEDYDSFEDTDGCPDTDNDQDGIPDTTDQCPNEPETKNGYADEDGCPDRESVSVIGDRILLDDRIYFEFDQAVVAKKSVALVGRVAELIKEHPEYVQISIEGHTDEAGSAEYNQRLSEARASAVRDLLIKNGVEPYRLVFVGYGETRPVKRLGPNEDGQINRRVEFYIIKRMNRTGETINVTPSPGASGGSAPAPTTGTP